MAVANLLIAHLWWSVPSVYIFFHVPTSLTVVCRVRAANIVWRPCSDSNHVTAPYKLSFYYHYYSYTRTLITSNGIKAET